MIPGDTLAPRLRVDARRNTEQIRAAASDLFRLRGFGVPLEEIAQAAGVSKGTIYHRFGSREGLVAELLEELVGECVGHVAAAAAAAATPGEQLEEYLRGIWTIQYLEPAANDVLIRVETGTEHSDTLCGKVRADLAALLASAQQDGAIRADITATDLDQLVLERGHALRAGHRPERADFARQMNITLRGLHP